MQAETSPSTPTSFSLARTLRLGTFQIGSAMGDILVTSIWNRVMIANLGVPAWPVSLLIALRYLLSPISVWAGYRSDARPLWGLRRTYYIWFGRFLMVFSLPFLGLSLGRLGANQADPLGWLLAFGCFVLYGVGSLTSGSPFLALVRDSAPLTKQGLAISLVETTLIIFFAVVGITFGRWMEVYDPAILWQIIVATMAVGGFFWFFAILGVEKRPVRTTPAAPTPSRPSLGATFGRIWQDPRTRRFFFFLGLATFSAWVQDAILEPFGAEVFHLDVGETTRFNSYWQAMTVLTLVASAVIWRKRRPEQQSAIARGGLLVMAIGLGLLGASAFSSQVHLVRLALVVFGSGFGVYTFGGLNLMAVMTSDREAGAYLGLWTIAVLVSRGIGTSIGGVARDLLLAVTGSAGLTYGTIFSLEAVGLLSAILLLTGLDVLSFARDTGRLGTVEWQMAAGEV